MIDDDINIKPGKSYLIYGYDFFHNYEIINMLIKILYPKYNEILFFDPTGHSNNINSKIPQVRTNFSINMFNYISSGNIKYSDLLSEHRRVASFISKLIKNSSLYNMNFKERTIEELMKKIEAKFRFDNFSVKDLVDILNSVLEKPSDEIYRDFFKILDSIEKIKEDFPNDFIINENFKKLAQEARLKFEYLLLCDPKKTSKVLTNFKDYIFSKESIDVYKKIKNAFSPVEYISDLYSSSMNIKKNQINYIRPEDSFDNYSEHLKFYLGSLVYKKRNSTSYHKPLIFIHGLQKKLLNSNFFTIEDILSAADICFIVNDSAKLDRDVNNYIDIKFYKEKERDLSIPGRKYTDTIKLEDHTIYYIFDKKY